LLELSCYLTISIAALSQTVGLAFNIETGFGLKSNFTDLGAPLIVNSALESANGCGPHIEQSGIASGGNTLTLAITKVVEPLETAIAPRTETL